MEQAFSRQIREAVQESGEDLSQHTIGHPGDHLGIEREEETGAIYKIGDDLLWLGDEHIEPFVRLLLERANKVGLEFEL